MSDSMGVLDAAVQWYDGFVNRPDVTFLLDRKPNWNVYEKRPCAKEQLSGQQVAIVGDRQRSDTPGWHIYLAQDDGFVTFFTWGGKPDNGFGGARRTVTLTDGTSEEVIGGWHVSSPAVSDAGFPPVLECAIRTDYFSGGRLVGGIACFIDEARFVREVEVMLPDCELTSHNGRMTVKWKGKTPKREFMARENVRRDAVRARLRAKYGDGYGREGWYHQATDAERKQLECRPYSALGKKKSVEA